MGAVANGYAARSLEEPSAEVGGGLPTSRARSSDQELQDSTSERRCPDRRTRRPEPRPTALTRPPRHRCVASKSNPLPLARSHTIPCRHTSRTPPEHRRPPTYPRRQLPAPIGGVPEGGTTLWLTRSTPHHAVAPATPPPEHCRGAPTPPPRIRSAVAPEDIACQSADPTSTAPPPSSPPDTATGISPDLTRRMPPCTHKRRGPTMTAITASPAASGSTRRNVPSLTADTAT